MDGRARRHSRPGVLGAKPRSQPEHRWTRAISPGAARSRRRAAGTGRAPIRRRASRPISTICSPIRSWTPSRSPLRFRRTRRSPSGRSEAGKHVFVEKPLAQDTVSAQRVADLADERGLVLMVGHLLCYHPGVRQLSDLIARGELGEVRYLHSQRLNLGKIRADENALWSLGAHDISMLLELTESEPVEVAARGQAHMREGIEDVVFAHIRFETGLAAHLHLSWLDPHKVRKITVVGSERMATLDDMALEQKADHLGQQLRLPRRELRRVHHPVRLRPQPDGAQHRAAATRVRPLPRVPSHRRPPAHRRRGGRRGGPSSWRRCRPPSTTAGPRGRCRHAASSILPTPHPGRSAPAREPPPAVRAGARPAARRGRRDRKRCRDRGHVVIHAGTRIADGCVIQDSAVIGKPPKLSARSTAPTDAPAPASLGPGSAVCAAPWSWPGPRSAGTRSSATRLR